MMIVASAPSMPSGLSRLSLPPPKIIPNCRMLAIAEIAAAIIAAIELTRMSRFLMWANSCASTARI